VKLRSPRRIGGGAMFAGGSHTHRIAWRARFPNMPNVVSDHMKEKANAHLQLDRRATELWITLFI
jgi:hypothetical protein